MSCEGGKCRNIRVDVVVVVVVSTVVGGWGRGADREGGSESFKLCKVCQTSNSFVRMGTYSTCYPSLSLPYHVIIIIIIIIIINGLILIYFIVAAG